jgi:hypothetical protein
MGGKNGKNWKCERDGNKNTKKKQNKINTEET